MIAPRQYYCSVCSGLFNQTTSGPIRQYCPDHDGQKWKNQKNRQEYNSNYYRKQRAVKCKKLGVVDVLRKRIEDHLEQIKKLQFRIDEIERLSR